MDNGILASRDAPFSNTEQQSIGDPAIADWETDDEEGVDPKPVPGVIITLFKCKAPNSPPNTQSLLTMSLLQFKEQVQAFDNSPLVVRRTMFAEEDQHSHKGPILPDMVQERKRNANPYLQRDTNRPRKLHNYSGLKATRLELPANDQGDIKNYKPIEEGNGIVYVGHCNDSENPCTISFSVKGPSGSVECPSTVQEAL